MEEFQIFISYSRRDMDLVKKIRDRIETATGARCWIDLKAIESGAKRFTNDIINGINNCEVFLFMLSESSQHSEFALRELDFADKKGKHVVIININDCVMTDEFQFLYGLTDTISWNDIPQREKLLRDLKRWVVIPDAQKTPVPDSSSQPPLSNKPESSTQKKNKSFLWIVTASIVVLTAVVLLLVLPKKDSPMPIEPSPGASTTVLGTVDSTDVSPLTPKTELEFAVNDVSFKMKLVEGGTFQMGNSGSDARSEERPVHKVTLDSFYLGEAEVTQVLWKVVMGTEPTYNGGWESKIGKGDDYPAYRVSWTDAQEFIGKLNQITGMNFRLPTEAEWEYAARGDELDFKYSGGNVVNNVAWYADNSGSQTHPVKTKTANKKGLFDMSGNVWEWCGDWYGRYDGLDQLNPTGPSSGSERVLRGGGWYGSARDCRVTDRISGKPNDRVNGIGFRLALSQ